MKKTTLISNLFLLLATVTFSQTDPSVTSIIIDNSTISENGGVSIITATLSSATTKVVTIPLMITGTASINIDYSTAFSSKGNYSTVAGGNGFGSANNQLNKPYNIYLDSLDNIYVVDHDNHRIMKWLPESTEGIVVAGGNGEGSGNNQLSKPTAVVIDSSGNIYIADRGNNRVMKWLPGATEGILVAGGNGRGSSNNQLSSPTAIVIDSSENLYIIDRDYDRIMKWTSGATEGILVAGGNGYGTANNQFAYAIDLYLDDVGNIYVLENLNPRVMKWAPGATEGILVAGGNNGGSANNQFSYPSGIYLDSSSNIYVADSGNDRVMKWIPGATEGTLESGGNGDGSGNNQFSHPRGIQLDSQGNVYVADRGNHRIQKKQVSPQIVIPAGSTTGSVIFTGIEDGVYNEIDETIIITPSNPINATLASLDAKTVAITNYNYAPVALAQNNVTATEQIEKTITLAGTDSENDTLTYIVVTLPSNGKLTDPNNSNAIVSAGDTLLGSTVTYESTSDTATNDNFAFKVNDGVLDSNNATVSININLVNDVPTLTNISGTTNEDVTKNITLNAVDPDNSQITYSVATNPTNGNVSITNNIATYTPNSNFNGNDSFTVTANDGQATSSLATISITVNAVNDAPVAINNSILLNEGATTTTLQNGESTVLFNDTDVENSSLTATLVSNANNGTLTLNTDGTFSYEHNGSETTSDNFTYKVNDGNLDSNTATVNITVNPVNDNMPTEILITNNSIQENLSLGVIIGQLSVLDIDLPSDNHSYELVSGNRDDNNSSFNINGKNLIINTSLDFETQQNLSIRVKTTDQNNQAFEKSLTINVINVNDISITFNKTDSHCNDSSGNGKVNITSVNQTLGTLNYSWLAANGGVIPTGQESNSNLSELTNGTYNLSLSDNHFTYTQSFEINLIPQYDELSICYVSSDDSETTKNRINLNNQGNYNVAFYEILRESSIANVYTTIGTIASTENSFLDNTSNNASQAYNYKVRLIDNCGITSSNSDLHKTMLLQSSIAVDNSVNLNWSDYQGASFTTYNIFRNTNKEGFQMVGSVSANSNSYNDTTANVADNNYEYYISIEVNACLNESARKSSNTSPEIKSNHQDIGSSLSLNDFISLKELSIYPNPTSINLNIKLSNDITFMKGEIYNTLGQIIMETRETKFSIENLPSSTYFIKVFTSKGTSTRRFIKK